MYCLSLKRLAETSCVPMSKLIHFRRGESCVRNSFPTCISPFMFLAQKMMKKKKRRYRNCHRRVQNLLLISEMYHSEFVTQMQVMMVGFIQPASLQLPTLRRCWSYERQDFWFQDLWLHFDEDYQGGDRCKGDFRIETFLNLSIVSLLISKNRTQ